VEVIKMQEAETPGSFYWFDPFSLNQHTDNMVMQTAVLEQAFGDQIKGIGKTLIIASPWEEPQFLSRAWCLFELYISVHTKVDVSIQLPERQRKLFIESITKDCMACVNSMERIDVRKAQAFVEADKNAILSAVEKSVTFDGLNKMALTRMREWWVNTILDEEARRKKDLGCVADDETKREKEEMLAFFQGQSACALQQMGGDFLVESERFMRECWAYRKRLFGETHIETITAINNLALVVSEQGKFEESENLIRIALTITGKQLGTDSSSYITSANNLALQLQQQAKYDEAMELSRMCLDWRVKNNGIEDPATITAKFNLGSLLQETGNADEARPLLVEALESRDKVHGSHHLNTLTVRRSLATLEREERNYKLAETLLKTCMDSYDVILGSDHPNTVQCINDYALVLMQQNDDELAAKWFRIALERYEKIYKEDHIDMMATVANIGFLAMKRKDYAQAEPYMLRDLTCTVNFVGDAHPDTISGTGNLAALYQRQERYDEAEIQFERQLKASEQCWGIDKKSTVKIRGSLTKCKLQRLVQAKELAKDLSKTKALLKELRDVSELCVKEHQISTKANIIKGFQEVIDEVTKAIATATL